MEINDSRLTFVIPPGQRVFLLAASRSKNHNSQEPPNTKDAASEVQQNGTAKEIGELQENYESTAKRRSPRKRKSEPEVGTRKKLQQESTIEEVDSSDQPIDDDVVLIANPGTISVEITNPRPKAERLSPPVLCDDTSTDAKDVKGDDNAPPKTSQAQSTSGALPQEEPTSEGMCFDADTTPEIILPNIRGLQALSMKILEVDGRIRDVPNGNAWKEFRSYRDNQDMGSLWEVRQAWYLRAK